MALGPYGGVLDPIGVHLPTLWGPGLDIGVLDPSHGEDRGCLVPMGQPYRDCRVPSPCAPFPPLWGFCYQRISRSQGGAGAHSPNSPRSLPPVPSTLRFVNESWIVIT